jgi:hypothetical protein
MAAIKHHIERRELRWTWLALLATWAVLLTPVLSGAAESLEFRLWNDTFARNIEHTGIPNYNVGQTFIGNITKPYLRYHVNSDIAVDAGAVLSMPFGEDKRVDTADPMLALHYQFLPGMMVTAGTINRNHPMLDAIFNNDILQYTKPVEQGFQFLINRKHIKNDMWINWEQRETATRQERFNIGDSLQLSAKGFVAETQVYYNHAGGQQNTGGEAINNVSTALGGGYVFQPKKNGDWPAFFDSLGVTVHHVNIKNSCESNCVTTNESGRVVRVFTRVWNTDIQFLNWEGGSRQFVSVKSDPLYKADHYQEFSIQKTFWLTDYIGLTFGYKGQYVPHYSNGALTKFKLKDVVHEDLISIQWQFDYPLLRSYFKSLSEDDRRNMLTSPPRRGRLAKPYWTQ